MKKFIPLPPLGRTATLAVTLALPFSPALAAYPNVKTTQNVVQETQSLPSKQVAVPGPEYVSGPPILPFDANEAAPRYDVAGWAIIIVK